MKAIFKENPLVFLLVLAALALIGLNLLQDFRNEGTAVEKIRRNDYENDARQVTAVLETELGGQTYRKKVDLSISPMELTEEEKTRRLDRLESRLPDMILGENESLQQVTKDLYLFTEDPSTGATLSWKSSDPDRIDEKGRVYPTGEKGAVVQLEAVLELDGLTRQWAVTATHQCVPDAENLQRTLDADLTELRRQINEDSTGRYADLPERLPSGIAVTWKAPSDKRYLFLGFLALLAAIFLYRKKQADRIDAWEKRRQEIAQDFPYFLDKLVMLLSAGIILTESVSRIWNDYERYQRIIRKKVFYEELGEAVRSMHNSNAAFSAELIRLSERLQVREFARLAVVLRDSLGSGTDLVTKLENENILLWRERKAAVQTLGRVADTKLIFPLMIILTVLIVIVMTPAVLQL